METILINYTDKRKAALERYKISFTMFEGKFVIETKFSREDFTDMLDSL